MRQRAIHAGALVAALALVSPTIARADDDAAATEFFNAGRDLMRRGDYAAACPRLAESVRLKASVGALAKLAACEEHEKRLVVARTRWQQALNLAHSLGDAREGEVAAGLARIDKVVPKLSLVAAAGTLAADVVIRVDDLQVGSASLGLALAVEPGHHTVTVSAPQKKTWSASIEAKPDGATTPVSIPELEDLPRAPESPPTSTAARSAPPSAQPAPSSPADASHADARGAGGTQRTAAIVIAGAGGVALGVAAFFGIEALRKRSDAGCDGTVCATDASAATLHDAKSAATASTALVVVGGALLATGVTLFIFAPSGRTTSTALARTRVDGSLTLGGVVLRGSF